MLQSLPYEVKLPKTFQRIDEFVDFYGVDGVYASVSGGLDSGVVDDILKKRYPGIPRVSVKILENKHNRAIIETYKNCEIITPLMSKVDVIKKYGYPVGSKQICKRIRTVRNPTARNEASRRLYLTGIKKDGTTAKSYKLSKRWIRVMQSDLKVSEKCCKYMKEEPLERYAKRTERKPIMGITAEEGGQRKEAYMKTGCNSFETEGARCWPIAFWTRQDVLRYTLENNVLYSKAYGEILQDKNGTYYTTKADRTGCDICLFGIHMEKRPHRFDRLEVEEPKTYDFWVNEMGFGRAMDIIGVKYGNYHPTLKECDQISLLNVVNK